MGECTKLHETARFGHCALHGNARESLKTRAFVHTAHGRAGLTAITSVIVNPTHSGVGGSRPRGAITSARAPEMSHGPALRLECRIAISSRAYLFRVGAWVYEEPPTKTPRESPHRTLSQPLPLESPVARARTKSLADAGRKSVEHRLRMSHEVAVSAPPVGPHMLARHTRGSRKSLKRCGYSPQSFPHVIAVSSRPAKSRTIPGMHS
jgi:hypothetical protein